MPWAPLDGTLGLTLGMNADITGQPFVHGLTPLASQSRAITAEPDVSFLFNSCLAPRGGAIEASDYVAAAAQLRVDVLAIKTVAEVETKGDPFDQFNRPTLLFERHYFHKFTGGAYATAHPGISSKTAGGYGKASAQYARLAEAYALDQDAALRSASWGRFQIMGAYFAEAGHKSVKRFVAAMIKSEREHLLAFVSYVAKKSSALKALQAKDWSAFAAAYNGPGYKKNRYDAKMKATYDRLSAAEKNSGSKR